jgi:hypothetical protein
MALSVYVTSCIVDPSIRMPPIGTCSRENIK